MSNSDKYQSIVDELGLPHPTNLNVDSISVDHYKAFLNFFQFDAGKDYCLYEEKLTDINAFEKLFIAALEHSTPRAIQKHAIELYRQYGLRRSGSAPQVRLLTKHMSELFDNYVQSHYRSEYSITSATGTGGMGGVGISIKTYSLTPSWNITLSVFHDEEGSPSILGVSKENSNVANICRLLCDLGGATYVMEYNWSNSDEEMLAICATTYEEDPEVPGVYFLELSRDSFEELIDIHENLYHDAAKIARGLARKRSSVSRTANSVLGEKKSCHLPPLGPEDIGLGKRVRDVDDSVIWGFENWLLLVTGAEEFRLRRDAPLEINGISSRVCCEWVVEDDGTAKYFEKIVDFKKNTKAQSEFRFLQQEVLSCTQRTH